MRTMDKLREHEKARVAHVEAHWELKRRLMEIGFTPGSLVQRLYRAPFGGPLVFSCRGTSIALRADEAERITVSPFIEPLT
jgi:ferrous iron transport protein A